MSEHKEPWTIDINKFNFLKVQGCDGSWILVGIGTDAKYRRIVACVNACKGFSTEKLEEVLAEKRLILITTTEDVTP